MVALKITTAFWHFGRGMAYAGRNQITNAEAELKNLEAVTKTVPADASFGNSTAGDVLKIADQMLAGKIAFARGDRKAALALLNQAAQTEDALSYNEPPDWDLPVRELLGGVLLLNEEYVEAERVFRAEIAKHRRNGRALFGLVESLKRQHKNSSALMVQREFEQAWETADTKLRVEDLAGMNSKVEPVSINRRGRDLHFSVIRLKTGVRLRYAEQGYPSGPPIIGPLGTG